MSDEREGQAIDFTTIPERTLSFIYTTARLAALVHDLGHGPLSHTFDSFSPPSQLVSGLLEDTKFGALGKLSIDPGIKRVPHEVMSCVFFALMWNDINQGSEEWMPAAVAAAILGPGKADCSSIPNDFRPWLPLIHDLIASAPADADRMDYLERDSQSLGVRYGLFDRNRLLKSFVCYQSAGTYRLGWKRSGVRAVENFVQGRFELFVQVYYHKTNEAISRMLAEIARIAEEGSVAIFADSSDIDTVVAEYLLLGDEYFMSWLEGAIVRRDDAANKDVCVALERIRTIAKDISARKLWKRVYETRLHGGATASVQDDLTLIVTELNRAHPSAELVTWTQDPKATKDLDRGAALLERDSDGIYSTVGSQPWLEASPIINVLHTEEKSLGRIYVKSSDKDLAAKLRVAATTPAGGTHGN